MQDKETYVCGDWGTFNEALQIFQDINKVDLDVVYKEFAKTQEILADESSPDYELACVEEWMIKGGSAVPKATVLYQRELFFNDVNFRTLKELLVEAQTQGFI